MSLLARAIGDATTLGYRVVSISGGEPLLYSELPSLLTETRRQGMQTTITTNGILLDNRHLELLIGKVDFVAISLDGAPDRHNHMRNAPRAFEAMRGRLASLRSSGLPFGFLFTLTHENVDDLPWAAAFAAAEGALILQVHPLEETGRARSALQGQAPTDVDAAIAWLIVDRLSEQYSGRLRIHLDFLNRDVLREFSSRLSAATACADSCRNLNLLADLISPLVVESDGAVVPLQYGFPRAYALGNLNQTSLAEMAGEWLRQARPRWERLCDQASGLLCGASELPFVNWYESLATVARESHQETFAILSS